MSVGLPKIHSLKIAFTDEARLVLRPGLFEKVEGFGLVDALEPLTVLPHWVVWRWEKAKDKNGNEKPTKVPYQPNRPSAKASTTKAATWGDYQTARQVAERGQADGIGFCLMGSGIAAFDLDDCRNPETGEIDEWARHLIQRVGSYAEVTISGTGLRIIGLGEGSKVHRKQSVDGKGSLETYRQAERYIVMTGNLLPDSRLSLENIDRHIDEIVSELDAKKNASKPSPSERQPQASNDDLDDIIKSGCGERFDGDRSRAVWFTINELLRRGHYENGIETILLDKKNGISAHLFDQPNPEQYAGKQIAKALKDIAIATDEKGKAYPSQANIRVALLKLGVRVRYDRFADRMLITGLDDFGPELDDGGMDRLRLGIDQRYRFLPSKDIFYTVVQDSARLNGFHPVRDYLHRLKWDGTKRIDKWLTTYGGAESSEYVDAVGALMLIAAVHRIRQPGSKFDEMVVLEGPQGTDKSSALAAMAVKDDWFTDDLPLNMEGKRVIEALQGKWIVEAAELSGMKRADIGHLKAFLARQFDRGRMAYDRITKKLPRQCIIVGTTNDVEYLKDTTGNRRYWPVRVKSFNLQTLRKDRDQLWAEASAREASGASVRLDRELWPLATVQQEERTTEDPYVEILRDALDGIEGKIASEVVWNILDVPRAARGQEQGKRVTDAMRRLGWKRPNNKQVKIGGRMVTGFTKGAQPWAEAKPKF